MSQDASFAPINNDQSGLLSVRHESFRRLSADGYIELDLQTSLRNDCYKDPTAGIVA